jgi:pyridoxine 4-dehydrogenase
MRITGREIFGEPPDGNRLGPCCGAPSNLASVSSTRHDAYGPEASEELIAEALHPYPDDLVVSTKCGLLRRYPRASSATSASRRTSSSGGGAITTSQTSWASTGWGGIINPTPLHVSWMMSHVRCAPS